MTYSADKCCDVDLYYGYQRIYHRLLHMLLSIKVLLNRSIVKTPAARSGTSMLLIAIDVTTICFIVTVSVFFFFFFFFRGHFLYKLKAFMYEKQQFYYLLCYVYFFSSTSLSNQRIIFYGVLIAYERTSWQTSFILMFWLLLLFFASLHFSLKQLLLLLFKYPSL